jgi:Family of unknown function (DUF5317)
MVFLDVVVVALLVALALGGRPSELGKLEARRLWLVFVAMAIQVVAFPSGLPWTTPDSVAVALWLVSYGFLMAAAWSNRRIPGVVVMSLGLLSNLIAIVANGGHMPALPEALAATGHDYDVHNNSIQIAEPHFSWLVDRWGAPEWVPLANVFSVGDVLIAAGLAIAVIVGSRPRAFRALAVWRAQRA